MLLYVTFFCLPKEILSIGDTYKQYKKVNNYITPNLHGFQPAEIKYNVSCLRPHNN